GEPPLQRRKERLIELLDPGSLPLGLRDRQPPGPGLESPQPVLRPLLVALEGPGCGPLPCWHGGQYRLERGRARRRRPVGDAGAAQLLARGEVQPPRKLEDVVNGGVPQEGVELGGLERLKLHRVLLDELLPRQVVL